MDPSQPESSQFPATDRRRRRGCFGFLFTSGLGCVFFLVGCLLAAVLIGPSFLAGPAKGWIAGLVGENIDGSISIEDLELSWGRPQKAKGVLFDPHGERVLDLEITFPPLVTVIFDSQNEPWRIQVRLRNADIALDADGVSNLERALAYEGELRAPRPTRLELDEFELQRGLDQPFEYSLDVRCDGLRLFGPQGSDPLARVDASMQLRHVPGGLVHVALDADVALEPVPTLDGSSPQDLEPGKIVLAANFRGPFARPAGPVDGELTWKDLPTRLLELFSGAELEDVLGAATSGKLELAGDLALGASLTGGLQGAEGRRVELSALVAEGALRSGEDDRVEVELPLPSRLFEDLLAGVLPADTALSRVAPGERWSLAVESFLVPLPSAQPGGSPGEGVFSGLEVVAELRPAGRFDLLDGEQRVLASLEDLQITLSVAPGAGPDLDLEAKLGGELLTLALQSTGPLAELARGAAPLHLDLHTAGCPTRAIGHLTGREELLREVFGETLILDLKGPLRPGESASATFTLVSATRRARWEGELVDGVLLGEGEAQRLDLELPLTPLVRKNVLSALVPWIEVADEREDGTPTQLVLQDYRLPLDGDPAGMRATVVLKLGKVDYRLSQEFHDLFHAQGAEREQLTEHFQPIHMTVDREMITYDELFLPLGEEDCRFEGSLDLRTGTLHLRAEVPANMALRGQAKLLDFMVPVVISGTEPLGSGAPSDATLPLSLSIDFSVFDKATDVFEQLKARILGDGE